MLYRDLWPGIDLCYSGGQDRLKYEFVLRPGALFNDVVIVPLPPPHERTEHYEIGVLAKSPNPQAAWHFARYVTARDKGLRHVARHRPIRPDR